MLNSKEATDIEGGHYRKEAPRLHKSRFGSFTKFDPSNPDIRIFPTSNLLECLLECFTECLLEILHIVRSPCYLRHCDKAAFMALGVCEFRLGYRFVGHVLQPSARAG